MKKSPALFILFAVLFMGMVEALSLIPHTHGDDFNHSKHSACPIYQAGLHGLEAVTDSLCSAVLFSLVFFLLFFGNRPTLTFLIPVVSVRAPPTVL
jgi:hypothetical protein